VNHDEKLGRGPACRAEIDELLASLGVGTLEAGEYIGNIKAKGEKLKMRGMKASSMTFRSWLEILFPDVQQFADHANRRAKTSCRHRFRAHRGQVWQRSAGHRRYR
jgi:hypothetical protein